MGVAAAALTAPLLATTSAHADVPPLPLPVDVNCTIHYGGHSVYYMEAEATLSDSQGCTDGYGPDNSCNYCDHVASHGGRWGPVTDGSRWTITYRTAIELGSEIWTSWDASACNVSDFYTDKAGNTGYHLLTCNYRSTFIAYSTAKTGTTTVPDVTEVLLGASA